MTGQARDEEEASRLYAPSGYQHHLQFFVVAAMMSSGSLHGYMLVNSITFLKLVSPALFGCLSISKHYSCHVRMVECADGLKAE